jgi:hypothetical protein
MYQRIEKSIRYLINNETTSEISCDQYIRENNELFQLEYRDDLKQIITLLLQEWSNNHQTEQSIGVSIQTTINDSSTIDKQSEYSSSSSSEEEEDEEEEEEVEVSHERHVNVLIFLANLLILVFK